MKKRILYVSFYFPPIAEIASLRAFKMTKYMARAGYQISVLCASPLLVKAPKDANPLKELEDGIALYPALYPDPAWCFKLLYGLKLNRLVYWILLHVLRPSPEILWLPFAKRALDKVLCYGPKPDYAIVSFGPPAVLKLALYLKKRFDIPYILDWRDEYTQNPERLSSRYFQASESDHILEKEALKQATACVYLNEIMRENFGCSYRFLDELPSRIIPNGFDEEDFVGLGASHGKNDKLIIYFSGSFYGQRQADPLWQAVAELFEEGKIEPDKISFIIRGKNQPHFVLGRYHGNEQIRRVVKVLPHLPYRQNLRFLYQADALLLYIPSGPNTDSVLTGKLFEYLRVSKPVLAVIPPQGLAAKILSDAGLGFIAKDTMIADIKEQLLRLYILWQDGALIGFATPEPMLKQYSRQHQASLLMDLIESS